MKPWAAEELDAVQADLHALVGREAFRQRGLAGEREALLPLATRPAT